jgi:hypothetical protein
MPSFGSRLISQPFAPANALAGWMLAKMACSLSELAGTSTN